jgi:hypothetical protein
VRLAPDTAVRRDFRGAALTSSGRGPADANAADRLSKKPAQQALNARGSILPIASDLGPFLPWVDSGGFSANIGEGIGFFALGLLGALVTIYLFLGEWLPSMGGKTRYETLRIEIEDLEERRQELIRLREDFIGGAGEPLSDDQRAEASRLSDEIRAEIATKNSDADALYRRILAQGFALYALLGGAFAVLFAETLMQALLIGFGWTAIADRLGLKREEATKTGVRDREIRKLEKSAEEGADAKRQLESLKEAFRAVGTTTPPSNEESER